MEDEPMMRLTLDGEEFEATPDNTHLYTHMGRLGLAMYDHLFLQRSEQDGAITGTYLFNRLHMPNEVFEQLADYMLAHEYHADLNRTVVADCDKDAYDKTIEQQMGDFDTMPEGWE